MTIILTRCLFMRRTLLRVNRRTLLYSIYKSGVDSVTLEYLVTVTPFRTINTFLLMPFMDKHSVPMSYFSTHTLLPFYLIVFRSKLVMKSFQAVKSVSVFSLLLFIAWCPLVDIWCYSTDGTNCICYLYKTKSNYKSNPCIKEFSSFLERVSLILPPAGHG